MKPPAPKSVWLLLALAGCAGLGGDDDDGATLVDPGRGSARGGDRVTISGAEFGTATDVRFGEAPVLGMGPDGADAVSVTTPPGVAGLVDVEVDLPGGTVVMDDVFAYDPIDVAWTLAVDAVPSDDSRSRDAEALDVDSDDDLDVLVAVREAPPRLYLNDGAGRFSLAAPDVVPVEAVDALGLAAGDVDGDGVLDAYLPVYGGGQDRLLLGDGVGRFTDATATALPVDATYDHDAILADLDGDGDLDVVTAVQNAPDGGVRQDRILRNDGGRFTDVTATSLPAADDASVSVAAGDLDGDGDLDLVVCNDRDGDPPVRLYMNDGAAVFAEAPAGLFPGQATACRRPVLADGDGDGDLDLFAIGAGQDRAYRNDGWGHFLDQTALLLPVDGTRGIGAAARDLDRDGDPDLVIAAFDGQDRLYLDDGTGRMMDETVRFPEEGGPSIDVVAADFDRDGADDLLVTTETGAADYLLLSGDAETETAE